MKTFVKNLLDQDIHLTVDNGDIKVNHNGNLTVALKTKIRKHKEELVSFLKDDEEALNHRFIENAKIADSYPLSSGQYRLWLTSKTGIDPSVYNMNGQIPLQETIDIQIFKEAIFATIERHEILRTVFKENAEGEIRQWIVPFGDFQIDIDYVNFQDFNNHEELAKEYIEEDLYKSFDLENGPLLRLAILQLSQNQLIFYYNMHHIISDGWSFQVIINDTQLFYEALSNGSKVQLPKLRIQYKDFANWQVEQLKNGAYQSEKAYWLKQFSSAPTPLNLTSGKARPVFKTSNGIRFATSFSPEVTQRVNNIFKKNGGTLFMGLITLMKIVLYKYTGENDITVGSPIAGRNHKDLENQIGFYVNTLALRNRIDTKETFAEFFKRVKDSILNAYQQQAYPFDALVQELSFKRDVSRSPLFDFSLVIENDPTMNNQGRDKDYEKITDQGKYKVQNDVAFIFREDGDCLDFSVAFNSDVYEYDLMMQFMGHYKEMLMDISEIVDSEIADITLSTDAELGLLLDDFNDTGILYDEGATVLDLISAQVSDRRDSLAVVSEEGSLTYGELDDRSYALAGYLHGQGVSRGSFVPICMDRSLEMSIVILGIMKAGCAYVPLSPDYPSDRIGFILGELGSGLLLVGPGFRRDSFPEIGVEALDVRDLNDSGTVDFSVSVGGDDLAYVIYTSGTTGRPKGVMNGHSGLLNRLLWMRDDLGLDSSSVILQKTPYTFDVSVWELLLPLVTGGRLVFAVPEGHKDPYYLQDVLSKEGVTLVHFVPSMLSAFLETVGDMEFGALRDVVCSGESLSQYTVSDFKEKLSGIGLHNYYGPTEAAIDVTAIDLTDVDTSEGVSIGYPVANTKIYIVDEHLRPQPMGVQGELLIGGVQVSHGYLDRAELTLERFIESPFKKGDRLYRTGDLASWQVDGSIRYHGRMDDQVKIRGHRIELGEIESVLRSAPGIDQAIVVVKEDQVGSKHLAGYLRGDGAHDLEELRRLMQKTLPNYMIPSQLMELDEIPLTPNGKVDRKALPDIFDDNSFRVEYVAPRTTEEEDLVKAFEKVLKREKISVKDSFYNLGGDSIKSILLLSSLKQSGYVLSAESVMRNPIIEDLAELMVEFKVQDIDQNEVVGDIMLTPIQQKFFENPSIENLNYFNQTVSLKSQERMDETILGQCMEQLINHHDALRVIYRYKNLQWKQYNQDTSGRHFEMLFYNLQDKEDPSSEMEALGHKIQTSMRIDEGPLVKVAHFRLKDGDRLALIIHHLVIDGFSWRIILEDLSTIYNQIKSGLVPSLPLKTDSFQYWAMKQEEFAHGQAIRNERAYWENLLEQNIPSFPKADIKDEEANAQKEITFTLDTVATNLLQTRFHNVFNTQINEVLLTALGYAIKDTFQLEKSVIEMEGHGREAIHENVDISRTVGWFTSIFPIVLDISDLKEEEALILIKENLRSIPNNGIGYGILKHLADGFTSEPNPSVRFNYFGDFGSMAETTSLDSIFEYSSEEFGGSIDERNKEKELLIISGMILEGELKISVIYPRALYEEQTITRLVSKYERRLISLIKKVSQKENTFLTPNDLTFKGLSIRELNDFNKGNDIEDIYKLSPLQEGIYFTWLSNASPEIYFGQTCYRLKGTELNIGILRQAFEELIDRHAILRTSFTNQFSGVPLQVVWKNVSGNFKFESLADRKFSSESKNKYTQDAREKDIKSGFEMERPSQMRLQILDFGDHEYEFIWSHHHILMDGWCISLLIRDFYQILDNISSGKVVELPKPIKYSNYIKWLDSIDKKASKAYWENYLSGFSERTGIPFTTEPNLSPLHDEQKENLEITGTELVEIKKLCNHLGITQNIFIQGAWGYLLSRYNNTRDATYGLVVSGRPSELSDVQKVLGLFINTIPVRLSYNKDDSPSKILSKLHLDALESTSHHYLNFSEVTSQSVLGTELIDHVLVFKDYVRNDSDEANLQNALKNLEITDNQNFERNNFDYDLEIIPSTSSINITLNYNANKFEKRFMSKVLGHFKNIVAQFVARPDDSLNTINYVSPKEIENVAAHLKGDDVPNPDQLSVMDLFLRQVRKTPDSVAVQYENKQLTYRELDNLSYSFSKSIQNEHQVRTGDVIGLYLDHCDWVVVAILGIIRAGAAFMPISTELPETRKRFLANESNMKLLITEINYIYDLDFYKGAIMAVDAEIGIMVESNSSQAPKKLLTNDLAYVIFTSGSTGSPKGVQISHGSLYNYINWGKDKYLKKRTNNNDFGLFTPLSFDLTMTSLFLPIISGGCLHVFDSNAELSSVLTAYLSSDISCIKLTPAHISLMDTMRIPEGTTSLKVAIVGGDILRQEHVKTLKKINPKIKVYNEYGPTEATVGCTVSEVVVNDHITIGTPIANTQIYILDETGQPVPEGIKGEICIGGLGLSIGYIGQPKLTDEKFMDSPYEVGAKLYRTGDIGRLFDGNIIFHGRMDNQVKINGFRIELGEIESILGSKERMKIVLAQAKTIGGDEVKLVVYFTSEIEESADTLKAYLSKKIPEYMMPSYFIQLKEFPMNINGKIDGKALPDSVKAMMGENLPYVAPTNENEQRLVQLVSRLTGLESKDIGIEANFFDLGINSLELMKMVNLLSNEFNTEISITLLFEHTNIKSLALNLHSKNYEIDEGEEPIQLSEEVDQILSDL